MSQVQNSKGSYSIVIDEPLKQKRRSEHPTIDGDSVVQQLGSIEMKVYRFFWITTEQLQDEIELLEDEASEGWVIVGEIGRSPIAEPLDLYNAQVVMHRYIAD